MPITRTDKRPEDPRQIDAGPWGLVIVEDRPRTRRPAKRKKETKLERDARVRRLTDFYGQG